MEKRFLLAFALSFFVLFAWSAITPKSPEKSNINYSQPVEIKRNAVHQRGALDSTPPPQEVSEKSEVEGILTTLDLEKLTVRFSNLGGNLRNAHIKEFDTELPIINIGNVSGYENDVFVLEKETSNSVLYVYEDNDYKISKRFEVSKDDYTIQFEVKIQNKTEISRMDNLNIDGFLIDDGRVDNNVKKKSPTYMRDRALFEYAIYSKEGIYRKNRAFKFSHKERKEVEGKVYWVGFRNRYFCALIKPYFDVNGYFINPINDKKLKIQMQLRGEKIPPGGSTSFSSLIYIGPENLDILKKYDVGFEKIRRYYKFGLFDAIAKLIYSIMQMLHRVIPVWGVCIMFISIIIYFSMYPMTMRSMMSMRKMQAIQPKMAGLKEKHKNNPQKLNKEMMELYKKHKVNPLGGCLPMILQLPVFIGLYQVLWRSVSFKGSKFLWIRDLSAPDRLFIFPFSLPIIGNEFNLLPILMIFVMAFQQRLSAKNMAAKDPQQVSQQKMMMIIMPLMMGFIFYKFASGLTLYFTMFYLFSTFTQWKMSKKQPLEVN